MIQKLNNIGRPATPEDAGLMVNVSNEGLVNKINELIEHFESFKAGHGDDLDALRAKIKEQSEIFQLLFGNATIADIIQTVKELQRRFSNVENYVLERLVEKPSQGLGANLGQATKLNNPSQGAVAVAPASGGIATAGTPSGIPSNGNAQAKESI